MSSSLPSFSYLKIYHRLRSEIVVGIYPYGVRLPSKRQLAEQMNVSVITIAHAYDILCEEGYAEARQRSGYYACYRAAEHFQVGIPEAPSSHISQPLNLHASGSDFPFTVFAKTMRRVLSVYGERLLLKSPNFGCSELRSAIAAYLARSRGFAVQPAQVIIGSGAEYLYGLIVQLLGRERLYALENPSYEKIRRVYRAQGVSCDFLKLGQNGIRTDELMRTQASVLHVTPYHSFPSGITASASKRNQYLQWAQARQGYIIEDDFDSECTLSTKAEDTLFSLDLQGRVLYLNTFSKTIAPSLRVGYLVLPIQLLPEFRNTVGFYSCTVPTFEQYVLAELLNNGDFERHISRVRRKKRRAQSHF